MRVLYDGVPVERSAEVYLQDGRELVGVDQVDDGHGRAEGETQAASNEDQPEAPAEVKGQESLDFKIL